MATFTDEELRSRLDIAVREAISVAEKASASSGDARAEEPLHLVNDLDH